MKSDVCSDPAAESRLERVLADYLQVTAVDRLDRDRWLAANPEHAEALREFIDDLDWMRRLAGPVPARELDAEPPRLLDVAETGAFSPGDGPRPPIVGDRSRGLGSFGDYELLAEIARGGMGVVYKARQVSLDRIVAVKMILSGRLAAEEDVRRFHAEASAAAVLNHPGIVPVYEVGNVGGQHYYSMAFVDGVGLNALIRDDEVPAPREAAELVRRVADAIHYAHRHGVIHRDLKPANILLEKSERGDAMPLSIAGQSGRFEPRITDFGLAKKVDAGVDLTGTGQVLGTPTYMAPEQAAGKVALIGPPSDVYALGALLYCLLAGNPPFRSATVVDTLQQVIHDDPIPPRQVNASVPRDLETICLKCLQKDPARRYHEAGALADDLGRFLAGKPIEARPVSQTERLIKWVRRQPAVAGLVAASLIAALSSVGLAVAVPLFMQTQEAHREAERQRARAERLEFLFRIALAERYWREGRLGLAREMLLEDRFAPLRNWEWYYLDRTLNSTSDVKGIQESRPLGRHEGAVRGVAFSREAGGFVSGGSDGTVRVWSASGESFRVLGRLHQPLTCLAVSTDGKLVAAAGGSSNPNRKGAEVRVWSIPTGGEVFRRDAIPAMVRSVGFSPDGARLAVAIGEETNGPWGVKVWEMATWEEPFSIAQPRAVSHVVFSPDGLRIAGTIAGPPGQPGVVKTWDARAGGELLELKPETDSKLGALAFSPDGRHLLAGDGSSVTVWEAESGAWVKKLSGHLGDVRNLAFSPDGTRLVSAADDGTIKLWDWERHKHSPKVVNPENPFYRRMSRSGGGVYVQALLTLRGNSADNSMSASSVAFSLDGGTIASGSSDGVVRLFDGRPRPKIPRS